MRLGTSARAITAEARRADIIDIHSPSHAFLPLILRVFRDKPITVHADPERLDARAGAWGTPLRRRLRSALDRHVYRRATIVIAPTGAAKRVLVEDFGVAPWSVKVLTTGVDATRAWIGDRDRARKRLSIGPDVFVACAIRPLVSRQGLRILLDAWSKLVAERALGSNASRLELLIGGGEMIDGSLEQELAASAFSGTVRVLAEVTEERLADLYRVADVQVIPSRPAAGRGRVVLEAATCGTPSIVALASGLSDTLVDLDETLIVAVNEPAALTRRLAAAAEGALPSRASTREWAKRHRLDLERSTTASSSARDGARASCASRISDTSRSSRVARSR
jgi:glycosyltransferase involved in cell wall biosynthesis